MVASEATRDPALVLDLAVMAAKVLVVLVAVLQVTARVPLATTELVVVVDGVAKAEAPCTLAVLVAVAAAVYRWSILKLLVSKEAIPRTMLLDLVVRLVR